jgi:protein associated with RNAse G/E
MKYRNKKSKIELDTYTKGGSLYRKWLDPEKMDEMIYTNLKKDKKKLK